MRVRENGIIGEVDLTPFYRDRLKDITMMRIEESKLLRKQKDRVIGRLKKERENRPNASTQIIALAQVERLRRARQHEMRSLHLARGYLKKTPYGKIENAVRFNNGPLHNKAVKRHLLGWLKNIASEQDIENWVAAV
jgi:hypothetical protein